MMRPGGFAPSVAWFALAAGVAALAGCASTPEASRERDAEAKRFVAQPGSATIYVYRNDFSVGSQESTDTVLYLDDRLIGATLPGTYFRIDARPGVYVLHGVGYDQGNLKLDARPEELQFVSLNVISGHSYFARARPEEARQALRACCSLLENWAPGQRPLLR